MDAKDLFILAIIGYQVVRWLSDGARIARDSKAEPKPPAKPSPRPAKPSPRPAKPAPTAVPPPSAEGERLNALLSQTLERAEALQGRGAQLLSALEQAPGPTRVLRVVLRDQVLPSLDALSRRLRQRRSTPGARSLATVLADPNGLRADLNGLSLAATRVEVLEQLTRRRSDPDLGVAAADADALADAMLAPIRAHCESQGVAWRPQRPIAVPANPGMESVWFGLLPEGWPIIFVPDDFGEDLYRQASVPHEIGHLVWRCVPGLADELAQVTGASLPPELPVVRNGRLYGSLDNAFSAWLSELHADAFTVLMLGPAGLRGLCHAMGGRRDVTVRGTKSGHYEEHPPGALRAFAAAVVLGEMGYDQEAKAILAEWGLDPGQITLALPTADGMRLRLPLEAMLPRASEIARAWYHTELRSLQGFALSGVPGLEMSPGLWARARRRAEHLTADYAFHDDPRVVLAAAIEARAASPMHLARIDRGVRRAILGMEADERHVSDPNYTGSDFSDPIQLSELRDALILAELLPRPDPRRLGPPRPRVLMPR